MKKRHLQISSNQINTGAGYCTVEIVVQRPKTLKSEKTHKWKTWNLIKDASYQDINPQLKPVPSPPPPGYVPPPLQNTRHKE